MPADWSQDSLSPGSDNDSLRDPISTPYYDQNPRDASPDMQVNRIELEKLPRRPGLGMVHDILDGPRNGKGPPSAEEAKRLLEYDPQTKLQAVFTAGEYVYLVCIEFYEKLIEWLDSGNDDIAQQMEPVDNTVLFEYYESFERPGRIRMGLKIGVDYVCVTQSTWEYLMEWFGGGPGTHRKVVNNNGQLHIDVRGLELRVKRSSNPKKFMRHTVSKYDTVGTLKRMAVDAWKKTLQNGFTETDYRIWDFYDETHGAQLYPDSAQLDAFRLIEGQSVMFEEPDPDTGEFLWDEKGEDTRTHNYSYHDYRPRRPANTIISTRQPKVRGAVGLSNLGNTCFMNSTLQCLSNIWPLRERFVQDEYLADINPTNVLGTGGKLAQSFGDLMKLLWSNSGDVVSPMGFKSVIAEFKPQFSGYQQHDSQELLSVLLDGLHEDLNRIKVKPITEPVEANGRPDAEVAAEACRVHRLRNSSFVNDLFEGFYKSTVVCPDCNKVSVTFDPFTMVQLPVSRPRQVKMVSYPVCVLDGITGLPLRPKPTIVNVPEESCIREVKVKACLANGRDPDDFIFASEYRERIDKIHSDFDKLDRYGFFDKMIAFGDIRARKLRMLSELHENGTWYRPIIRNIEVEDTDDFMKDFEYIDPASGVSSVSSSSSSSSTPTVNENTVNFFTEGEVWIGAIDQRKYRIRMQVSRVFEIGPWAKGLGRYVLCILDVSPKMYYSHYSYPDEGVEEAAYSMVGFMPLYPKGSANEITFEQTRFLGTFGSYYGEYSRLATDWSSVILSGTFDPSGFFHGIVEEKQPSYHRHTYYSYTSYSYTKTFALMRVDEAHRLELAPALAWVATKSKHGPRPPPPPELIILITLCHRRNGLPVGQLSVFTLPGTATPVDLYKQVLERMTARGRARLSYMDDEEEDPFGLAGTFKLKIRIPGTQPVELSPEDSTTSLAMVGESDNLPTLMVEAEWDHLSAIGEQTRAGVALFGPLYSEDNASNEDAGVKLYDCFDMFSEQEKLTATETWYCSNCKAHKEAYKRMELWDLPPVLIIHLKRFSQTMSSYIFDKDETEVDFPLENLDLSDRVQSPLVAKPDDCVYDLVAVSHHYGGLGGGHYIAHARNEVDGQWYEFDDSAVRYLGTCATAARKIKGSSAYVLMYMRRTLTRQKWGSNGVEHRSLPTDAESSTPENDDDDDLAAV